MKNKANFGEGWGGGGGGGVGEKFYIGTLITKKQKQNKTRNPPGTMS